VRGAALGSEAPLRALGLVRALASAVCLERSRAVCLAAGATLRVADAASVKLRVYDAADKVWSLLGALLAAPLPGVDPG
jgi:hypothetical protein